MTRPLRIAQIITRLDRGGSSDMVLALCERLNRERFDVTLITGPSADPAEEPRHIAERLDITVAECARLAREIRPWKDLQAFLALSRYLRKLRPDVVHTHTSKAGALGRIAAKLAGGVPVVHSPHGHLFYGYYGGLGTGLVTLAERTLAPLAEAIAVLTDTSRNEHLERGVGTFDQYVTVHSGVDLGRFRRDEAARHAVRGELGLGDRFVVGWVGRFAGVKGPDVFVEACARIADELPDARFLMAGDGELRPDAETRAAELGIKDRCAFLGRREDIPAVLNACDAFVLSSRNEGLGLAVVEAMACGTPVVATDVGGVREVLDNGRCGVLVPLESESGPSGTRGLADAVVMLAKDDARRGELVRAGLERAKHFSIAAMVEHFAEVYEELA